MPQAQTNLPIVTYSPKERLLINLIVATFALLLAQLNWPLQSVSFGLGTSFYLLTLLWWIKQDLPALTQKVKLIKQARCEEPGILIKAFPNRLFQQNLLPAWHKLRQLGSLIYPTQPTTAPTRQQVLGVHETRIYWLMIIASLALGLFYALSFIRFLNAHNGVTMFMVWKGLN